MSRSMAVRFNRQPWEENPRLWLAAILFSLIVHTGLVFWFSSLTPEMPEATSDDFRVGLVATEGTGETLEASLPDIVAVSEVESEETGIVTESEEVRETTEEQMLKVSEQLPPLEQEAEENIELAAVVTPETSTAPDVSPPAISPIEQAPETVIEESRPVEAVETTMPSAASLEAEVPETTGVSTDILESKPVNDFFKPAQVQVEEEPMSAMPIEQLNEVAAPEAIKPDNNPELAKVDVEILEIKAHEVRIQRKSVSRPATPVHQTTPPVASVEDEPLHPDQGGTVGGRPGTGELSESTESKKKATPVVIPKSYVSELKSLLGKFKNYPVQARRQKQEGVVIISLVIERSGRIVSHEIRRSSGHQLLDQEVEKMIQQAGKLPALPDSFPREKLELMIPIRFRIK